MQRFGWIDQASARTSNTRRRAGSSAFQSKRDIASAMIAERSLGGRVSEAQHLADDDQMIASLHAVMKFAIQPRRGIRKYRAVKPLGIPSESSVVATATPVAKQ